MAASNLQSNLVPLLISTDSGTTKKTLTCLVSANFSGTTTTTEEETQCGTFTGMGANKWEMSFDAVVDITPTSGTQLSFEDMLGIWHNQTEVQVTMQYPASGTPGSDFFLQGDAYVSALGAAVQVGSSMKFSGTLKGNGALDIAA
jgi:hypothetical protein